MKVGVAVCESEDEILQNIEDATKDITKKNIESATISKTDSSETKLKKRVFAFFIVTIITVIWGFVELVPQLQVAVNSQNNLMSIKFDGNFSILSCLPTNVCSSSCASIDWDIYRWDEVDAGWCTDAIVDEFHKYPSDLGPMDVVFQTSIEDPWCEGKSIKCPMTSSQVPFPTCGLTYGDLNKIMRFAQKEHSLAGGAIAINTLLLVAALALMGDVVYFPNLKPELKFSQGLKWILKVCTIGVNGALLANANMLDQFVSSVSTDCPPEIFELNTNIKGLIPYGQQSLAASIVGFIFISYFNYLNYLDYLATPT